MMNNARNASALQGGGTLPAWNSGDYLGYDGGGRMITKRYVSSALNESGGYVTPVTAIVGWTTAYDLASNKLFERALHAESRSALYEPYVLSAPQGGYDSVNRLRQYQRGTLSDGGGAITVPIDVDNTDLNRTYVLDGLGNWQKTAYTPKGGSLTVEKTAAQLCQ